MLDNAALLDYEKVFRDDPTAKTLGQSQFVDGKRLHAAEHIDALFHNKNLDLTFVSSCECAKLLGNLYTGIVCPRCHQVCRTSFATELSYRAWVEVPDFMPPILHPRAYFVLNKWLGKFPKYKGILDCLLDVKSQLPPAVRAVTGQGFAEFHRNFDDIMHFFLTKYRDTGTPGRNKRAVDIQEFLALYRDRMFVRHIPVLNSLLHVISSEGKNRKQSDGSAEHILKALEVLSNASYVIFNSTKTPKFVEEQMWKAYQPIIEYSDSILADKMDNKEGLLRKYILGARFQCSFRAVIVPITEEHRCDEVHLPWRVAVRVLKLEILNVLMRRKKYSMPQAMALWFLAQSKYVPVVDEAMQALLKETPFKGFPICMGRNPSVRPGAIQLVYVTKIKIDSNDDSLGLSPLIIGAPGADFDGDALYGVLLKEMAEVINFMPLHPMFTLLGDDQNQLSSEISLRREAIIALHSWLTSPDQWTKKAA